jgi:hypothetical protein
MLNHYFILKIPCKKTPNYLKRLSIFLHKLLFFENFIISENTGIISVEATKAIYWYLHISFYSQIWLIHKSSYALSPLWLHHIFVQINKKPSLPSLQKNFPIFVDLFAFNFLSFYPTRFLFFVSQLWLENKSDVAESMRHAKWPKPCPRTQV